MHALREQVAVAKFGGSGGECVIAILAEAAHGHLAENPSAR